MADLTRTQARENFSKSLQANVKEMRKEQAEQVAEELEIALFRRVEDAQTDVSKFNRLRRELLDFTPDSTTAIVKLNGFDAEKLSRDLNATYQNLHNAEKVLEIAKRAYDETFVGEEKR